MDRTGSFIQKRAVARRQGYKFENLKMIYEWISTSFSSIKSSGFSRYRKRPRKTAAIRPVTVMNKDDMDLTRDEKFSMHIKFTGSDVKKSISQKTKGYYKTGKILPEQT